LTIVRWALWVAQLEPWEEILFWNAFLFLKIALILGKSFEISSGS
jgi:hypothetical protein